MSSAGRIRLSELCEFFETPRCLVLVLLLPALAEVIVRGGARYALVAHRHGSGFIQSLRLLARMVVGHTVLRAVRWAMVLAGRMRIQFER